jgi:hypothetical protein
LPPWISLSSFDHDGREDIPRLWLTQELEFFLIVGQHAVKHIIRVELVTHLWNRPNDKNEMCLNFAQHLSMIFAGPRRRLSLKSIVESIHMVKICLESQRTVAKLLISVKRRRLQEGEKIFA